MALAELVRTDGDSMHEGVGRALATDEDADGVLAVEGDHAARAPQVLLADLLFESGDGQRGSGRIVREAAAVPGVDEQRDVVGAAEAIGAQSVGPSFFSSARSAAIAVIVPTSLRPECGVAAD